MTDLNDELERLKPEARQRVEETLRKAIETELADRSLQKAAAFSRSVFSRSAGRAATINANTINALANIDEAAFKRAAERLSQLSSIKAKDAH